MGHDPFHAIIAPRPIGWISTRSKSGVNNLAPYSFFNALAYKPSIIGFSSSGWKDSVENVKETGEFVWNLSTQALAQAMNMSSKDVQSDVDEFALAGLTAVPGKLVSAPRIGEAQVSFECRLTEIIQLSDMHGAKLKQWVVCGQVVAVHIDRSLIVDGAYDTAAARPILRAGDRDIYSRIEPESIFRMARPA